MGHDKDILRKEGQALSTENREWTQHFHKWETSDGVDFVMVLLEPHTHSCAFRVNTRFVFDVVAVYAVAVSAVASGLSVLASGVGVVDEEERRLMRPSGG